MIGDEEGPDDQDRQRTRWSILRAMSAVGPDCTPSQWGDPDGYRWRARCCPWAVQLERTRHGLRVRCRGRTSKSP